MASRRLFLVRAACTIFWHALPEDKFHRSMARFARRSSGANLFLLNPAGVIFGANASIDVSGSFAVTTGQEIKLSDGAHFNATPGPADALLTSAPPVAFGFLTANSGYDFNSGQSAHERTQAKHWPSPPALFRPRTRCLTPEQLVIRGGKLTMDQTEHLRSREQYRRTRRYPNANFDWPNES